MVGPVINIGPQGSGRYQIPDYSPIASSMANVGGHIAQGLGNLGQGIQRGREQDALAEFNKVLWSQGPQAAMAGSDGNLSDDALKSLGLWGQMNPGQGEPEPDKWINLMDPSSNTYRNVIEGSDEHRQLAGQGWGMAGDMSRTTPDDDRTSFQKDFEYLQSMNPGLTPEQYWDMRRGPGTIINTGDEAPGVPPISATYDPNHPNIELDTGYIFDFDPVTNEINRDERGLPIQIPKPGGKIDSAPPSEAEVKVANVTERANFSLQVLAEPGENGEPLFNVLAHPAQSIAYERGGIIGNYYVSEDYQRAKNAGDTLIESTLRLATGAAAPEHEVKNYANSFLPRPGDKPGTIEQKYQQLVLAGNIAQAVSTSMPNATPEERMAAFNQALEVSQQPGAAPAGQAAPTPTPQATPQAAPPVPETPAPPPTPSVPVESSPPADGAAGQADFNVASIADSLAQNPAQLAELAKTITEEQRAALSAELRRREKEFQERSTAAAAQLSSEKPHEPSFITQAIDWLF